MTLGFYSHACQVSFRRRSSKKPSGVVVALLLTCDVQIVIPATLIDGLIRALNTQKATHERQYGTIHEPGALDAKSSGE
jgi:hypothetical protein